MDELAGKVAVVTGAGSGIGRALADAFAAEGMRLVLADIEPDALDRAGAELAPVTEVVTVSCDVSSSAQVEALRDAALDRFGAVHVVCNNAGVSSGGPIWETSEAEWEWVLGVNLWGVIHGVRAFTPVLIDQGEGHIVNTASMAGLTSMPFVGPYNVSKHGVVTLSETLFADLAMTGNTGVGVSVLCPGWVRTRIHEAGRNRPEAAGGARPDDDPMGSYVAGLIASGHEPADVAALVVDGIRHRRFYLLTHPDWNPMITRRTERIVAGEDPRVLDATS